MGSKEIENCARLSRKLGLDEIERAHVAVGGSSHGRRLASQQINRAYARMALSRF
jgi:hypothetical protein